MIEIRKVDNDKSASEMVSTVQKCTKCGKVSVILFSNVGEWTDKDNGKMWRIRIKYQCQSCKYTDIYKLSGQVIEKGLPAQ